MATYPHQQLTRNNWFEARRANVDSLAAWYANGREDSLGAALELIPDYLAELIKVGWTLQYVEDEEWSNAEVRVMLQEAIHACHR